MIIYLDDGIYLLFLLRTHLLAYAPAVTTVLSYPRMSSSQFLFWVLRFRFLMFYGDFTIWNTLLVSCDFEGTVYLAVILPKSTSIFESWTNYESIYPFSNSSCKILSAKQSRSKRWPTMFPLSSTTWCGQMASFNFDELPRYFTPSFWP